MTKRAAAALPFEGLKWRARKEGGESAALGMLTGSDQGTELGTGFGQLKNARLEFTVPYDEVLLVLEGRLNVTTPEGVFDLGPRDSVWLPKGTDVIYETKGEALIFFALHPASAIIT
jgi:ethanolamine utilization protein EutQ